MLIVTGATGALGSAVLDQLLRRVPAGEVGVSVRDPDKARGLARRGVRVRAGDFTDPAGLEHAFEDADRVLVVSAAIRGEGAVQANRAAIDAAVSAGASRVLYTSHQAASHDSAFAPQAAHAATEDHLAGLSRDFTALRNGFYASSLAFMVGDAVRTGTLAAPEDGPVSWTAHADLAEAAAVALIDDELDGVTPPLTGPEAITLEQVARQLSDLSGRPVSRVVLDDEDWVDRAVEAGQPEAVARFTLGMYVAARRGEFDVVDPTLPRLLARPPIPARAFLEQLISR